MLDNDRASVPPPDHDFIVYVHKILSDLTPSSQRLLIVFFSQLDDLLVKFFPPSSIQLSRQLPGYIPYEPKVVLSRSVA